MRDQKNVKSIDPAAKYLLEKAQEGNVETGWDRFDAMQDACGFGDLGLCCRHCMMGPCRIDPFGEGPQRGICGISADGIVARNLCRMIASGTSAHSDHGVHILEALERVFSGDTGNFKITDPGKLKSIAAEMGLKVSGKVDKALLGAFIDKVKDAFSNLHGDSDWMLCSIPKPRLERFKNLHILPSGIDPTIRETMHRTHMGVDADPVNLLLGGLKCSLADYLGMDVSTIMSDILLGTPAPVFSRANLGVLDKDAVNVAVHGHNPLIGESLIKAVPQFQEKAKKAGAKNGFNLVGICCTGNEVLMRHGIPLATNFASQELAILTGAVDAMVVDVQCIMPSLGTLCECCQTELITTTAVAKIPGAKHYEFDPDNPRDAAHKILELAVEAFKKRDPKKVDIPDEANEAMAGFSVETIISVLEKVNADDPLKPVIDNIVDGNIYGVVLFAGCNNYKVAHDSAFIRIAEKLAGNNILIVATGCGAGAFAKNGFLSPRATPEICGEKLMNLLTALGQAAGLDRPLPPVWHMGSCVDNTRAARLVFALANKLGVDVDKLPVAASAPEAMSEKAVSIGTWAVTMGLTTHLGVVPPVLGGKAVTKVLTETAKDLLGSCFIVETDPNLAAQKIKETITEKRIGLGLKA
jgi:carbon-monoxide dehydrogenase catalytic subunit